MCALFGSSRDINFLRKINYELLDNVIQQEIDYYKYNLPETKSGDVDNIYGEASTQKSYFAPLRVTCLITREDQAYNQDDQFGIDVSQTITINLLKPKLREVGLVPMSGDIFEVRGSYYEIDQIIENQFILGRDNDYGKSPGAEFGESWSIACTAHLTRVTRLQIIKGRF